MPSLRTCQRADPILPDPSNPAAARQPPATKKSRILVSHFVAGASVQRQRFPDGRFLSQSYLYIYPKASWFLLLLLLLGASSRVTAAFHSHRIQLAFLLPPSPPIRERAWRTLSPLPSRQPPPGARSAFLGLILALTW